MQGPQTSLDRNPSPRRRSHNDIGRVEANLYNNANANVSDPNTNRRKFVDYLGICSLKVSSLL